MPVLAKSDTIAGPLTAQDLDAARQHSTGRIHQVPAGCGQQRWPERRFGTHDFADTMPAPMPAECCTELGADPDPYDGTALVRGLFSAIGITAIIAAVVIVLA